MLYSAFYTDFVTQKRTGRRPNAEYWEESGTIPNAHPHIILRRSRGEKIARLRAVRPGLGEVFYLRLLLLHHSARSFQGVRTINGVVYETFQHAARAAGLLEEDNEGQLAMEDAIAEYKLPSQLRFLFVLLITEGSGAVELWDRFKDDLARDYLGNTFAERPPAIQKHAHNRALQDIQHLLNEHNKTTVSFGLPEVDIPSLEVAADLNYFSPQTRELNAFADRSVDVMSADQRSIYHTLHDDIFGERQADVAHLHFLTGKAGRGKSFIVKALIAKARGTGFVAAVAGTTALSISDIDGGRTAHTLFRLPVVDDDTAVVSRINDGDARADFLREALFIVWDELPMANISAFEAVDALLREVMGKDAPFGGKVVVAIGDFRQVAPVVKGGGPTDCYLASVLSSPLWHKFRCHELTVPVRNASDPDFADFVDRIGEDTSGDRVNLREFLHHCDDVETLQQRLYPHNVLSQPELCVRRAFLTPLNVDVDQFNAEILDRLPTALCMFTVPNHHVPLLILFSVYSCS